jgi:hypothetical protein
MVGIDRRSPQRLKADRLASREKAMPYVERPSPFPLPCYPAPKHAREFLDSSTAGDAESYAIASIVLIKYLANKKFFLRNA